MMGNLDLRNREGALKGGQHGPAIIPGDAANSRLYRHVTGQLKPQMPMGGQLTDQQIAIIKNWIDSGAEWESAVTAQAAPAQQFTEQQRRFWAFQPVSKPAVPRVKAHNPIDAFVLAKLDANKLKPNPPADRITLIRRAYLDLTGLPPSPEEVESFIADKSPAAF